MKKVFTLIFTLYSFLIFGQDIYQLGRMQEIKITFSDKDWHRQLDSLKSRGEKERIVGDISVNGVVFKEVGIRYKGNSSFYNVQKEGKRKLPFNIDLNYINKEQELDNGIRKIKLSNIFRDPSYLREVLAYEIARKYMPAPQANFARVYVNGDYLGLYNNVESIDPTFLDKHFDENDGVLVKCDPDNYKATKEKTKKGCSNGQYASLMYMGKDSICYKNFYEMKSDYGWKELIELISVLNKDLEKIESILNVDQTLWMHAFNNVLVSFDSYAGLLSHNYYLYQDSTGIFQPLLWDMNLAFGGFFYDGMKKGKLSLEDMQTSSMFLHYKNPNRPLINNLLSIPIYRKIYIAHVKTILEQNFSNGWYLKRAKEIQNHIDFYVKTEENNFYGYDAFKNGMTTTTAIGKVDIVGIDELMAPRVKYFQAHPLFLKEQPKISRPTSKKEGDKIRISCLVEGAENVFIAVKEKKTTNFKLKKMEVSGNEYTFVSEKEHIIAYYIVAESSKVAAVYPEEGSFKAITIK